jgi:hypothetical protein
MFKIVIPSYNRPELIKTKTLATIDRLFKKKYPIYVFTPEPDKYVLEDNIIVGKCNIGLIKARNHIMNFFDIDDKLLILDDDIDDLIHYDDEKSIEEEIIDSFEYMDKHNIKLGGFNPTKNKFFSSGDYKKGLLFCVGCAYLLVNDRQYMDCNDELEDYYRSLEYYLKYGNNFRNDKILIKTKYEENKGGMYCTDRYDKKTRQAVHLLYKYPKLVKLKMKKKYLGIRLQKNKMTKIVKVSRREVGLINGKHSKHTSSPLDPKINYFFVDGNKIIGYVLRNIYSLPDNFKYSVEKNQNSGDIAGTMTYEKIPGYTKNKWNELNFNKQKTRSARNNIHRFEFSNEILRKSKYIVDCEQMTDIYNTIGSLNYFNDCNKVIINKELAAGFHRDFRNNQNYVLLITKNNKLLLDIPEYNLIINNNDGDVLCFDSKTLMHANNDGDVKNRYSIVFYNGKK